MRKFITMFFITAMVWLVGYAGIVSAGGGQVGKDDANPVFSVDGVPVGLMIDINEGCEVAVLQSQVIIFCDGDSEVYDDVSLQIDLDQTVSAMVSGVAFVTSSERHGIK